MLPYPSSAIQTATGPTLADPAHSAGLESSTVAAHEVQVAHAAEPSGMLNAVAAASSTGHMATACAGVMSACVASTAGSSARVGKHLQPIDRLPSTDGRPLRC